ncbi:exported hypothetical protein [Candidatus Sulfopaludibacter sp. SbA4]|nr:exported hypothetical protein [Candidatus Sulfopaludibacter sp. SbA4]
MGTNGAEMTDFTTRIMIAAATLVVAAGAASAQIPQTVRKIDFRCYPAWANVDPYTPDLRPGKPRHRGECRCRAFTVQERGKSCYGKSFGHSKRGTQLPTAPPCSTQGLF